MKAGVEPAARPRPRARCARSAPPARRSRPRASSGSTSTSAATRGCSRPAAAPTSAPPSSAACPLLPVYRGELQAPRARRRGRGVRRATATRSIDEVGELVITEPMPSMPLYFWGDDGRLALPRRATSTSTRASGATATGSRSPRAEPPSSTAARTRRSTARACAWGRARSTARCRRVPRGRRRAGRRRPRARRPRAGCRCSSCSREGAELDDELAGEIKRRIREDCSPRHVPDEVYAIAEVPRTLIGQGARGPRQEDPHGRRPRPRGQPRLARQPDALDYFVELAGRL